MYKMTKTKAELIKEIGINYPNIANNYGYLQLDPIPEIIPPFLLIKNTQSITNYNSTTSKNTSRYQTTNSQNALNTKPINNQNIISQNTSRYQTTTSQNTLNINPITTRQSYLKFPHKMDYKEQIMIGGVHRYSLIGLPFNRINSYLTTNLRSACLVFPKNINKNIINKIDITDGSGWYDYYNETTDKIVEYTEVKNLDDVYPPLLDIEKTLKEKHILYSIIKKNNKHFTLSDYVLDPEIDNVDIGHINIFKIVGNKYFVSTLDIILNDEDKQTLFYYSYNWDSIINGLLRDVDYFNKEENQTFLDEQLGFYEPYEHINQEELTLIQIQKKKRKSIENRTNIYINTINNIFIYKSNYTREPMTLYRGMKHQFVFNENVGVYYNFCSTSINFNEALNFCNNDNETVQGNMYILNIVDQNIPYISLKIEDKTSLYDEGEILFPPGLKWTLIKTIDNPDWVKLVEENPLWNSILNTPNKEHIKLHYVEVSYISNNQLVDFSNNRNRIVKQKEIINRYYTGQNGGNNKNRKINRLSKKANRLSKKINRLSKKINSRNKKTIRLFNK